MSAPRAAVVLDTNTVLDWLVFREPAVAALAAAVEQGQVQWLACPAMRDELARTLGYRTLVKWKPDSERVLASFDQHAQLHAVPPPAPLPLRCSDPDDQVFLELALAHRATWLLTHDRALLKLARRARPLGLTILRPQAWVLPAVP
ncbi:putative toxin-antitoxin system toxin component, PIN family [Rubrivivax rivuli]|uniref:putative toxin-antitoxin system toxin component, PIN family n=1 Tax=Rubrivivax rivuli TaxID=1862385 RepID=UPI001FE1256D|nr:putative toxin-antitoxin system toxin component, PIN family [Rubrivivax rivuli]